MEQWIASLKKCRIFKNVDVSQPFIEKYHVKTYSKNTMIAFEGDDCKSVGIVLSGALEVKKIFASGNSMTMAELKEGSTFGEVIVFSDVHTYPATIMAKNNTTVLYILKEEILKLSSENPQFLENFLELLSNKLHHLNSKVTLLSLKSIREKLAFFILSENKKQNSDKIKLKQSKKQLAESFSIPRPSLSRELIAMKEDGIIDFDKDFITILDMDLLEDCLM